MDNPALIPGPLSSAQLLELEYALHSGVLPLNRTSAALGASLLIKASAGKLYGLTVSSTNLATQFIQVFDLAALPANGVVPTISFQVSAASAAGLYFGSVGRAFEQGIVVCNSSTQATKTIGAADCLFDAQYV